MSEKLKALLSDEVRAFFLKIMVPALVAVSIKIAIMNQQKKVSIFQAGTSLITGVGAAYLFSDLILTTFAHGYVPLVIAVVTISGEKIGYYLIYKFKVDEFIQTAIDKFTKK